MNFSNKGMDRRNFLKVGGMSTVALTLGTTGLFSLTNASKGFAAEATGNPTRNYKAIILYNTLSLVSVIFF